MCDPKKPGKYLNTISPLQASKFTYKQARALLINKKIDTRWIKGYKMLNTDTGEFETIIHRFSNEGVYCDDKAFTINDEIVQNIIKESEKILGLFAWNIDQLNTNKNILTSQMSYYDSALSDIGHAMLDKRPPADTRTKIYGLEKQLREKRRDVKQAIKYVQVMINSINQEWELSKLRCEMSKAMYHDYKGRTEYYELVIDMLG